jgi:hypothetical protein
MHSINTTCTMRGMMSVTVDVDLVYSILFTIVVVSLQEEGKKLFVEVLGSGQRLNEMRQLFQMLLSYWVWLKCDTGTRLDLDQQQEMAPS